MFPTPALLPPSCNDINTTTTTIPLHHTQQGMPIDSSVAELLTAQLFVLVQEAPEPIYFYINSTGIAVRGGQAGRGKGEGGRETVRGRDRQSDRRTEQTD